MIYYGKSYEYAPFTSKDSNGKEKEYEKKQAHFDHIRSTDLIIMYSFLRLRGGRRYGHNRGRLCVGRTRGRHSCRYGLQRSGDVCYGTRSNRCHDGIENRP